MSVGDLNIHNFVIAKYKYMVYIVGGYLYL